MGKKKAKACAGSSSASSLIEVPDIAMVEELEQCISTAQKAALHQDFLYGWPVTNNVIYPILDDESSEDANDSTSDVFFGHINAEIVGIRYYNGKVNNGEVVLLKRQPHNPYDKNAIQVNNCIGEQVGHLRRELAAALAKSIDDGKIRVEGQVPFGCKNKCIIPLELSVWGNARHEPLIVEYIRRHGFRFIKDGDAYGRSENTIKGEMGERSYITSEQMENELDKLFDNVKEVEKINVKKPAKAIATGLYKHQQQALFWMCARERGEALAPFWEKQKTGLYYNSVTRTATKTQPPPVLGGFLADDMGLGKTLSVLSLILTNFKDGRPLAVPVPGTVRATKVERLRRVENMHHTLSKTLQKPRAVEEAAIPPVGCAGDESKENIGESRPATKQPPVKGGIGGLKGKAPKALQEVVPFTYTADRPKRAVKRPTRYIADSDSDEDVSFTLAKIARSESQLIDEEYVPETLSTQLHVSDDEPDLPEIAVSECKELSAQLVSEPSAVAAGKQPKSLDPGTLSGRTPCTGARGTLIICPLAVISNWIEQIEEHIEDSVHLQYYVFHGPNRTSSVNALHRYDIVLSTYATIAHDFKRASGSVMAKAKFLRIVLDEGHIIRNPNALHTKAVINLNADRRWILTGTPIQNSIKDMWPLLNFLKVSPFTERSVWRKGVEGPVLRNERCGLKRIQLLLSSIALRRMKNFTIEGRAIVELPEKTVVVQRLKLSDEERLTYDVMQKEGKLTVSRYFREGKILHHYAQILAILMRLRQICCHPSLVAKAAALAETVEQAASSSAHGEEREKLLSALLAVLQAGDAEECSVCLEALEQPVITPCAHVFCKMCIQKVIDADKPQCPLCRADVSRNSLVEPPPQMLADNQKALSNEEAEDWQSSTKVDALMLSVEEMISNDSSTKALVVSQFTSLFALLETPLRKRGIKYAVFHGGMTPRQRDEAIATFNIPVSSGGPAVFLLSLKAGGVGLNLTAATRVFLLDPAWNPAVEDQCFDRCHRLGQTKPVTVVKFVVEDSVEERMLELQDRKRQLASGVLSVPLRQRQEAQRKQRINDIRHLMDL